MVMGCAVPGSIQMLLYTQTTADITLAMGIREWRCDAEVLAATARTVWSSNVVHVDRPYGNDTDAHWLLRSLAAVVVKRAHL